MFPSTIYEEWRGAAKMYMHAVRTTFTNELMKNSVVDYMSKQLDLTHGMMMCFRCHLSENQILNIMVFPDQETKEAFSKKAAGNLSLRLKPWVKANLTRSPFALWLQATTLIIAVRLS